MKNQNTLNHNSSQKIKKLQKYNIAICILLGMGLARELPIITEIANLIDQGESTSSILYKTAGYDMIGLILMIVLLINYTTNKVKLFKEIDI